jgi:hypothetical protein
VAHPVRASLLHDRPQAVQVIPVEARGRLHALLIEVPGAESPQR